MGLSDRVLAGDARAVARAISLIEDEAASGADLIKRIYPRTGHAYLVGITGPPGAGKSTLVDRLTGEINKTMFLKADQSVSYGRVVQIVNQCRKAGVERIGLMAEKEKER